MNFKEIYKAANDDIEGDRSIIENIFNEKKMKKHRSNVIYPFASVAAAAVIMLSVASFPLFSDRTVKNETALSDTAFGSEATPLSENPAKTKQGAAEKEVAVQNGEAVQRTEAVTEKKAFVGGVEEASVKKSTVTEEAATETAPVLSDEQKGTATNDSIVPSVPNYEESDNAKEVQADLPAVASMPLDTGEAVEDGESSAKSAEMSTYSATSLHTSGGGAARGGSTAKAANEKIMTADEFFDYIGIRRESFELTGYTITVPKEVSLTENDGKNYFMAELYLENNDKKINVVIENSHGAAATEISEYENEVHVYSDNGEVNIYVSGYNASRSELEEYVNSLMK